MLSRSLKSLINSCLDDKRTFAVYALPYHTPACIVAGENSLSSGGTFFINDFNNTLGNPLTISGCSQHHNEVEPPEPYNCSTVYEDYKRHITDIVNDLKKTGGKTVYSRTLCGDASGIDWAEVTDRYFSAFPDTFRFIYYTPVTGAWLGASPEILLERKSGESRVYTMSLAGTTSNDSTENWDEKNIKEHDFVTRYITDVFNQLGIKAEISPAEDVYFGTVKHLCNRISGEYTGDFFTAINVLSPTPALAGVPLSDALEHIGLHEPHPRRCYGGYTGVLDSEGEHAYVNLRSVHFSPKYFCIYAGGGITSDSNPDDEWTETRNKVQKLHNIILSSVNNGR